MRFFTVRRFLLATALPAVFALSAIPGCSNQNEGERCGDDMGTPNDADCSSGLICKGAELLQSSANGPRCCPPNGAPTDSRCILSQGGGVGGASSGGTGGAAAGTGGGAGSGGDNTAGSSNGGSAGSVGLAGAAGAN